MRREGMHYRSLEQVCKTAWIHVTCHRGDERCWECTTAGLAKPGSRSRFSRSGSEELRVARNEAYEAAWDVWRRYH